MRKSTFSRVVAFTMALILILSVAATALASYDTIPYGEQSDNVRKMQSKLKSKGFYTGSIDGKFGPATRKAVYKFQSSVGITADGKPGNKTLTALYDGTSALNKTNNREITHTEKPSNPRALYYGCSGSRVKSLQRALKAAGCYKGSIDGVYGDLTYDAVKKYQYQKGLKADGIAGTKTLASLNKNTNVTISSSFVLDVGSSGEEVKKMRVYLNNQGYTNPNDTGSIYDYTAEFADSVKRWQKDNGKTVTGTITESQYNEIVIK